MAESAEGATRRVRIAALLLIAGLAAGPIGTHVYWMLGGAWGLGLEGTYSATGVRDELLEIGKPWNSPVARLAAPSARSSWFWST